METQDQSDIVLFLKTTAGPKSQRIDTHISTVIIGQDRVYKLKRAVKLPYLDFSTPELRLAACEIEFALNRRTAGQLYIGVKRLVRRVDGSLSFDGVGNIVDSVVEMNRFNQDDLFDAMAQTGRLTPALLTQLAREIARFHGGAERRTSMPGSDAIEAALAANEAGFAESRLFDPSKLTRLFNLCHMRLDQYRAMLDHRGAEGFVRRGHGDLHLRNICLFEGKPVLFDCLEFDEMLATTDVLYDLAFLLMDLVHRDLRADANLVMNRYVDETGDDAALSLLPFLMAVRAAVRAHVGAASANGSTEREDEARSYLDLALALLQPHEPSLVAVAGLSGSGKSSVAAAVAADIDLPPGARVLSTDRLRKKLAGITAEEALPPEAYTQESSERVYGEQRKQAGRILAGGWSVIADGVFLKASERQALEAIARDAAVPFSGLWLDAPRDVLAGRVAGRRGDPSDATVAVLDAQIAASPGALEWRNIDAARGLDQTVAAARATLKGGSA
jgi:aminoglycoside phosphotransferase family enzyme/predicted kinase